MNIILPTRTPESHSVELLPRELAPRLYCGPGLFYSRCKPILFFLLLLNFMRFLSTHFSSLSASLWTVALPSSTLSTHPSLVFCADLLRMHSVPSPRLLMKTLNSISPILILEGFHLVAGCLLNFASLIMCPAIQSVFHLSYNLLIQSTPHQFCDKETVGYGAKGKVHNI